MASWTGPSGASTPCVRRPREVHRTHHTTVPQRIAVAVFEVRNGLVGDIADEWNRVGVTAERGPGQCQSPAAPPNADPERATPGSLLAAVVDLVEDDQRVVGGGAQGVGR